MGSAATLLGPIASLLLAQQSPPQTAPPSPPPSPPQVAALFHAWQDERSSEPALARDLRDLADAHVDAMVVVERPRLAGKEPVEWTAALRDALAATRGELAAPVRVALDVEPLFVALDRAGGEGGERRDFAQLDLTDARDLAAFLAPIERFFSTFPGDAVATVDGAPLLVLGHAGAIGKQPDDLLLKVAAAVKQRTGKDPTLLLEKSWSRPDRRIWESGSSLVGVTFDGDVATLGPGYDDRGLPRPRGLLRLRDRGRHYAAEWSRALARKPRLVLLETWNGTLDGSELCTNFAHGKSYVEATRRFGDLLRAGATVEPPFERWHDTVLTESYVPERELALADTARFTPGVEEQGLTLVAAHGELDLAFERARDDRPALAARPRGAKSAASLEFEVSPLFVGRGLFDVELTVDQEGAAHVEPTDLGPWERGAPARFEVHVDGPVAIREIRLRRRDGALPSGRIGVDDPDLFAAATASDAALDRRLALARSLGVEWLRFEVPWSAIAPTAAALDVARVKSIVARVRAAGLEPVAALTSPPKWAQPAAAHAKEAAAAVAALVDATALRCVELFPGADRPSDFSPTPDALGSIRVLRTAAKAARAVDPRVVVTLGAIDGPDRAWLRTIDGLHENFAYDALTLRASEESGELDSATFRHGLRALAGAAGSGPDADKPFFVELGVPTAPSPLLSGPARGLLAATIAAAWRRLDRKPSPIHLLDAGELPRVGGLSTRHARELLLDSKLAVVVEPPQRLYASLADAATRTVVLAQGELAPSELVKSTALAEFVDRGGLLVLVGGAPFTRSATRLADGAFELDDDASPALLLREELRIAPASFRPGLDVAKPPFAWRAGLTTPELATPVADLALSGTLFTQSTGRARNDHGFHAYDEFLVATADTVRLGESAALLRFSGARQGAVLLLGLDADDHGHTLDEQRQALESGTTAALDAGARVVFWRRLTDGTRPDESTGLFDTPNADAAPHPRPAASALQSLASKFR